MRKPLDGRLVAMANQTHVLRALHRFGWLRTRDLAALIWQEWARHAPPTGPSLTPPRFTLSGLAMAQRTLACLREQRLVLHCDAPNGSRIYGVSERGARVLQGQGVPAASGKDLVRQFSAAHFLHRCIANEIAISAIIEGFRAATEREISQGRWLGGVEGIAGKKPDVLVRAGARVYWVEVERSRKNKKDYSHLLRWLDSACRVRRVGDPIQLVEGVELAKVIFVCTPAFAARLSADLLARGWTSAHLANAICFEQSLYSFQSIAFF